MVPETDNLWTLQASLRQREETVRRDRDAHLRSAGSERDSLVAQQLAAVFQQLLRDLVRSHEATWGEAQQVVRRDARWSQTEGLSAERKEDLYRYHVDDLRGPCPRGCASWVLGLRPPLLL